MLIPGPDAGIFMYGGMLIHKGYLPYNELWDNKPPLIYYIASVGYLYKHQPFLLIRIIEIGFLLLNLFLIKKIVRFRYADSAIYYQLLFILLYLLFWDRGFLTETFTIPINLFAVYLFYTKHKIRQPALVICWWLLFLLKPNSVVLASVIIFADILRDKKITASAISYILQFSIVAIAVYTWLSYTGMFDGFIQQVFTENINHTQNRSFLFFLSHHFSQPKYIALWLIIVTACILAHRDKELRVSLICFLLAYIAAFINGKNHGHYVLLAIVPATAIGGYALTKSKWAIVALLGIFLAAVHQNTLSLRRYEKAQAQKAKLVELVKAETTINQRIYFAGKDNAYLYIMADRLSSTRFLPPFAETYKTDSPFGQMLEKELISYKPFLLMIPKDSLCSHHHYSSIINSMLPSYDSVNNIGTVVIYKLHAQKHH